MLRTHTPGFIQPIPLAVDDRSPLAYRFRQITRIDDQCELSTGIIRLKNLRLEKLIPIIQKYSDLTGKVFSGYYDPQAKTFNIANCPYTGIGANYYNLNRAIFNEHDLKRLFYRIKNQTNQDVDTQMTELGWSWNCRPNERHIVIGLQEGIHGRGIMHSADEIIRPLAAIGTETKPVEVLVIRPRKKVYRESAVSVNIWDQNSEAAFGKLLIALNIARQWNKHLILEDLARSTAYSLSLGYFPKGNTFPAIPLTELQKRGLHYC